MQEYGTDEWNKLSEAERQQLIIERKMKEKQLRQEGRNEEAMALLGDLADDNPCKYNFCFTFLVMKLILKICKC